MIPLFWSILHIFPVLLWLIQSFSYENVSRQWRENQKLAFRELRRKKEKTLR
jgi:hypothetical protein